MCSGRDLLTRLCICRCRWTITISFHFRISLTEPREHRFEGVKDLVEGRRTADQNNHTCTREHWRTPPSFKYTHYTARILGNMKRNILYSTLHITPDNTTMYCIISCSDTQPHAITHRRRRRRRRRCYCASVVRIWGGGFVCLWACGLWVSNAMPILDDCAQPTEPTNHATIYSTTSIHSIQPNQPSIQPG